MAQPEKIIENQLISWLQWKSIFTFKVRTTGTFDQKLGRFRGASRLYKTGVSDILGIYKGRFIAIEVKAPKGRLSPNQILFQQEVKEHGGIALTIRSVEQLELELKIIDGAPL